MDNIHTLAYLAGFFDGEGSIYILKRMRPHIKYWLEISFTSSEMEPLSLAQSTFGGSISTAAETIKTKAIYRLRLSSQQAAACLDKLVPFMLIKKRRAELAIEFQAKLMSKSLEGSRRGITIEDCQYYKESITALNDKVWNAKVVS